MCWAIIKLIELIETVLRPQRWDETWGGQGEVVQRVTTTVIDHAYVHSYLGLNALVQHTVLLWPTPHHDVQVRM